MVNADGYYTGEQEASYEDAKAIKGVVSPPTGEVYRDMFGMLDDNAPSARKILCCLRGASLTTRRMSTSSNAVRRR